MKHLSKHFIDNIRLRLEKDNQRVAERIEELRVQDPFSQASKPADSVASDAEATVESSHDRYKALTDELLHEKSAIASALTQIDQGAYGICANCHNTIDEQRLMILPTATLCVECEKQV